MKKFIKKIKLQVLSYSLLCGLSYPIIKTLISDNKLVVFSDSCLIVGMVFIIVGIVYNFVLKGDLDITAFIAKRSLNRNKNLDFDKYVSDKQKERENSVNYPLLVSLILIIISLVTSLFA